MTNAPLPTGTPLGLASRLGLLLAVPLALLTYWLLDIETTLRLPPVTATSKPAAAANKSPTAPVTSTTSGAGQITEAQQSEDESSRLSHAARATAAITVLLGTLWISEALPMAATSLLPLVLFPLAGVLTFKEAAAPFADNSVYIYFGGFLLALAIERWNLHRRVALHTLLMIGTRPALLVGGLMLATALISMWISNTATTAMMLPLGLSLVALLAEQAQRHQVQTLTEDVAKSFATCMMLGIAYAATIGGLGTLIGTPTNTLLAGFAKEQGIALSFAGWMLFATPLSAIYLIVTWLLLTKVLYRLPSVEVPQSDQLIRAELTKLGAVSKGEAVVSCVFAATALLWLLREPLTAALQTRWPQIAALDDGIIALCGALALFIIPIDWKRGVFALDWQTANRMPWGILLLFGGGLSLAAAVKQSRLADWIGVFVASYDQLSLLTLVVIVTATIIFASEFTSNVATCAAFLPIMFGVSEGLQADPLLLMVATTLAASCAFMLPVGTPPNAIAFGTGHVKQQQMMQAGLFLNLLGVVLIPLAVYTLGAWTLGIKLTGE